MNVIMIRCNHTKETPSRTARANSETDPGEAKACFQPMAGRMVGMKISVSVVAINVQCQYQCSIVASSCQLSCDGIRLGARVGMAVFHVLTPFSSSH